MEVRTLVTFRSDKFNTIESKPYYINPHCFGDDVAAWMIAQLRHRGVKVDPTPGQEDFGWYVGFKYEEQSYNFVLSYHPDGYWMGWLERQRGLLGGLLGRHKKGIQLQAANEIHSILTSSQNVSQIRWLFPQQFDGMNEKSATQTPSGDNCG